MQMNPLKGVSGPLDYIQTSYDHPFYVGIEAETPSLYAFLATPRFYGSVRDISSISFGRADDPFRPPENYLPQPVMAANGRISYSVLLAFRESDASELYQPGPGIPHFEKFHNFPHVRARSRMTVIGYATISSDFRRLPIANSHSAPNQKNSPTPQIEHYRLDLSIDGIFISSGFRGNGFAGLAAIATTLPVADELSSMQHLSRHLDLQTSVGVSIKYSDFADHGEQSKGIENYFKMLGEELNYKSTATCGSFRIAKLRDGVVEPRTSRNSLSFLYP